MSQLTGTIFEFQSTRSARSATINNTVVCFGNTFQSTRSARSATMLRYPILTCHAFQSTRSARSATGILHHYVIHTVDFNPRAPRGARLDIDVSFDGASEISIHALREERDIAGNIATAILKHFNPRAPRGARLGHFWGVSPGIGFQSTRSARSATAKKHKTEERSL